MFGNHITDAERQADNITFVKLIAMNCMNFDMNECNFSDKIMAVKDKNGQSQEGSSRVALAKATGLVHCYTLEFNYHSGRRVNTLAPKFVRATGAVDSEENELTDPNSKIYLNQASPPYTKEIFEDCGRGVGAALLDFINDNPVSRIRLSTFRTVHNVRTDILNNLSRYEAGNVNMSAANNFAPASTKIARALSKAPGPRIKTNGSLGQNQIRNTASGSGQEKLKRAASQLTTTSTSVTAKLKGGQKPIVNNNNGPKRLLDNTFVTNTTASSKGIRKAESSAIRDRKSYSSIRKQSFVAPDAGLSQAGMAVRKPPTRAQQ